MARRSTFPLASSGTLFLEADPTDPLQTTAPYGSVSTSWEDLVFPLGCGEAIGVLYGWSELLEDIACLGNGRMGAMAPVDCWSRSSSPAEVTTMSNRRPFCRLRFCPPLQLASHELDILASVACELKRKVLALP